jgi:hypothetical protein
VWRTIWACVFWHRAQMAARLLSQWKGWVIFSFSLSLSSCAKCSSHATRLA